MMGCLWLWVASPPDEWICTLAGAPSGPPIDPVAAALERLVSHLRATVPPALLDAYGDDAGLEILRGWPDDAGATKASAPAILSITGGPPTVTPVPVTPAGGYRSGSQYVSTIVTAYWQAAVSVTLLCDDRDLRDKIAPSVYRALDPASSVGPRGLTLASDRYRDRLVTYRLTGASVTDGAESAMLGEWRQVWSLEARSDLADTEAWPALTEHRPDVHPTL